MAFERYNRRLTAHRPEQVRLMFRLRYDENFKLREIGSLFGITHQAVSDMLKRHRAFVERKEN